MPKTVNNKSRKNQKKNEDEEFTVEKILEKKFINGQQMYLVKWLNWSIEESTWEPLSHLTNAMDIVVEYEAFLKLKNKKFILNEPKSVNNNDNDKSFLSSSEEGKMKDTRNIIRKPKKHILSKLRKESINVDNLKDIDHSLDFESEEIKTINKNLNNNINSNKNQVSNKYFKNSRKGKTVFASKKEETLSDNKYNEYLSLGNLNLLNKSESINNKINIVNNIKENKENFDLNYLNSTNLRKLNEPKFSENEYLTEIFKNLDNTNKENNSIKSKYDLNNNNNNNDSEDQINIISTIKKPESQFLDTSVILHGNDNNNCFKSYLNSNENNNKNINQILNISFEEKVKNEKRISLKDKILDNFKDANKDNDDDYQENNNNNITIKSNIILQEKYEDTEIEKGEINIKEEFVRNLSVKKHP